MILKGLKERVRNRFNVAVAEEDFTDLWQRSRLAIVSVATEKQALITLFEHVLSHVEENRAVQVLESSTEYF